MTIDVRLESNGGSVPVSLGGKEKGISVSVGSDWALPYSGATVITPSQETQTLYTAGKRMTSNVIVNPIPSNYGLITWTGAILTVS